MKVLVTGGTGFIGSWVVDELIYRGHEPIVLDRHRAPGGSLDSKAFVFLGDIRDTSTVHEVMSHADGFIHLAGMLGTQETIRHPIPSAETNIFGGLNILEAAADHGVPGVNIAVGNHWMENTYSITKAAVERFIRMFNTERGTAVSTIRAFNAYGSRQAAPVPYGSSRIRKIMPTFICTALAGQPIPVYGAGDQIMDMIHVSDVASTLVSALEVTRSTGEPIEGVAGSAEATTVVWIAEKVAQEVEAQTGQVVGIKNLPMRPGEPPSSVVLADSGELATTRKLLGLGSPLSFEQGLSETVAWFVSHS